MRVLCDVVIWSQTHLFTLVSFSSTNFAQKAREEGFLRRRGWRLTVTGRAGWPAPPDRSSHGECDGGGRDGDPDEGTHVSSCIHSSKTRFRFSFRRVCSRRLPTTVSAHVWCGMRCCGDILWQDEYALNLQVLNDSVLCSHACGWSKCLDNR